MGERDLLHVNTLGSFDGESATSWTNVVHGAPVLVSERRAVPVDLPWSDDDTPPIVLLSFSTVPEQRSVETLQRALDALGPLPVHIVATTGGIVDPVDLSAPTNAHLVSFADHDRLMERASLVVGHGGHGTTMRALAHGLPIVGIPAKGADQVPITQLLDEWKVGRALPGDATVDQIRTVVDEVIAEPAFTANAQRRSVPWPDSTAPVSPQPRSSPSSPRNDLIPAIHASTTSSEHQRLFLRAYWDAFQDPDVSERRSD